MKTTETKNFDYLGSNIAFQIRDCIMMNATQMAKHFEKKASQNVDRSMLSEIENMLSGVIEVERDPYNKVPVIYLDNE